jgi:hypothetical protein
MLEFVGATIVVPVAIAAAVVILIDRLRGSVEIASGPLALALSFFVGYVMLPSWAPLRPERHWHWLPYLGLLAGVVAAVTASRSERWRAILLAVVCGITAWFLVPTWADLQPSRRLLIPALTVYLWLVGTGASLQCDRCERRDGLFLAMLVTAASFTALLVAKEVSVTYGRFTAVAAAGLSGIWLATVTGRLEMVPLGVGAVFAVLVGGASFVGFVDPDPPLYGLLLFPLAPWGALPGRRFPEGSKQRVIAQVSGFLVVTVIGIGIVLTTTRPSTSEW